MTKEGKARFKNVKCYGFLLSVVVQVCIRDGVGVVNGHYGAKVAAMGCIKRTNLVI